MIWLGRTLPVVDSIQISVRSIQRPSSFATVRGTKTPRSDAGTLAWGEETRGKAKVHIHMGLRPAADPKEKFFSARFRLHASTYLLSSKLISSHIISTSFQLISSHSISSHPNLLHIRKFFPQKTGSRNKKNTFSIFGLCRSCNREL